MSKDSGDVLKTRQSSEEAFYNAQYKEKHDGPAHYKLGTSYNVFLRMKNKLGDIKGRRVLDYGCGTGWITLELAGMDARVDSFDISSVAVEKTTALLTRHNLMSKCTVRKMTGEKLDYPDNCFDIIFGFAILHHLDLDKAISELHRVLKPSGIAYFGEPLGGNPFINLYRRLTPQYRTADEKPLVLKDIMKYTKIFTAFGHEELYLTALIPFLLTLSPVTIPFFKPAQKPFTKLDNFLLRHYPELGDWAWYTILSMVK